MLAMLERCYCRLQAQMRERRQDDVTPPATKPVLTPQTGWDGLADVDTRLPGGMGAPELVVRLVVAVLAVLPGILSNLDAMARV
ncbi:hypothetical protein [Rathayibacter iranicus]|uniref:hypothetical protein n=1 Tax=Rathayibacter iranicus TaxID=59737 RepID=UPI000FD972D7|nr:hypothetical protein [Rathayibacter iranicus]MWV32483.1 hypothetical protein [Rathayibacter iranicus NCPPB 2253 = VKM Ac-1602]